MQDLCILQKLQSLGQISLMNPPDPRSKRKPPVHVVAVKAVLVSIIGAGITRAEIIDRTGLHPITVARYIKALITGVHTFIYISRYIRYRNGGPWIPVYSFGLDKESIKKLPNKSRSQRRHQTPNWIKIISSTERTYYEYRNINHPEAGTTIEWRAEEGRYVRNV